MKSLKTLLASLALLIASIGTLSAQNSTLTPYSRFGYGILRDNATSAQQSMGGVGYAMSSGRQINVMNPASYARVDSLTFLFDMGIDVTALWQKEQTADGKSLSDRSMGGGLNYITMQFPIGKRMGMSIGVLPFSAVGYAFGNSIDNGYTNRSGSGSINQLYLGLAGRIVGGLNVGVNVSYMFGSTVNDTYAITNAGSTSLYEDELSVRDYRIQAGIQYTQNIGRDQFTVGLTYAPQKSLLGNIRTYAYDIDSDVSSSKPVEAHSKYKTKDLYGMAATYGAGLNYLHNNRLMLEADFTYQPWSKVKYQGENGTLADRYKLALGAQFQPTLRGSYLRRIQYRVGGYFNRDYLMVRGNNVREYSATLGLGLPVPGFKTVLNLGFGWVHRQAHPTPLIKENYFNFTLGINFNETWFHKRRID